MPFAQPNLVRSYAANDEAGFAGPGAGDFTSPAAMPDEAPLETAPPSIARPGYPIDGAMPAKRLPDDEREAEHGIWSTENCSPRLATVLRLVRPLSVGALIAVPTLGAAACGATAMFDTDTALGMARASTLFLQGIPGEVYMLVGFFGGGYGLAKTVERLKGVRR